MSNFKSNVILETLILFPPCKVETSHSYEWIFSVWSWAWLSTCPGSEEGSQALRPPLANYTGRTLLSNSISLSVCPLVRFSMCDERGSLCCLPPTRKVFQQKEKKPKLNEIFMFHWESHLACFIFDCWSSKDTFTYIWGIYVPGHNKSALG